MSRRVITPYIVAGLAGIVSGVYIFRPLFEEAAAKQRTQDELKTADKAAAQPIVQTQAAAIVPTVSRNSTQKVAVDNESKSAKTS